MQLQHALALVTLFIFTAPHPQQTAGTVAVLTKIVGQVECRDSGAPDWFKVSPLQELTPGSELRTNEQALVLVAFNDGSKVTVRPRSTIRVIGEISNGKLANRGLFLAQGRVVFGTKDRGRMILVDKDQMVVGFNLNSPVSISSLQAAEGSFSYDPSTSTAEISLLAGSADVSSTRTARRIHLKAGQTATIDSTRCRVR